VDLVEDTGTRREGGYLRGNLNEPEAVRRKLLKTCVGASVNLLI
jgi:hypothetical protein